MGAGRRVVVGMMRKRSIIMEDHRFLQKVVVVGGGDTSLLGLHLHVCGFACR